MSKIEIFEGDRAGNYENFVDTWIPNYRYFMSIVPQLLNDVDEKNLLVAGCGTGNEILEFGEELSSWNITGVDPSIEMLNQAKEKLKAYPNVKLINSRIDQLPEDVYFSAATLLLVLHFLPDNGNKLSLLKDIQKRLKPNATFVILDITGERQPLENNLKILKKLLPDSVDEAQKQMRVNRILTELEIISENRLSELLREAGFEEPTRFFQSSIYVGWITRKK
ncbi:class I SAM-dependent methyltransferase [Flexithrix dorotheae]|uniref:class I SAM-dependent methyltransferase n=1 Tax=Flexithrix dorotheae TaxID=70993 RepID=UPI000374B305|nr:class I SAM-dependent methyltransferase [Flexithrix dorotheae]